VTKVSGVFPEWEQKRKRPSKDGLNQVTRAGA